MIKCKLYLLFYRVLNLKNTFLSGNNNNILNKKAAVLTKKLNEPDLKHFNIDYANKYKLSKSIFLDYNHLRKNRNRIQ